MPLTKYFDLAQGNLDFFQALIEQENLLSFHAAVQHLGKNEILESLKIVKDVNMPSILGVHPPLFNAVKRGDLDLVQLLVEKGCDVNAFAFSNYGLYEYALLAQDNAKITHFLKQQKTLEFNELKKGLQQLYHFASTDHHKSFMNVLNKKFNGRFSPLIANALTSRAVHDDNPKPIEFLTQKGVRYHHIYHLPKFITVLHFAVLSGAENVTKSLLSQRFNPNILDYKKQTPLILAAQHKEGSKIIPGLIKAHADINAQDYLKKTALHHAVQYNQVENAKLLIQNGIDVHLCDIHEKTALDIAKGDRNQVLIKLIEDSLSKPHLVKKQKMVKFQTLSRQNGI